MKEIIKNGEALAEVKNINPRNRNETFYLDLKTGEVFNRNLEKIGSAKLNKKTQVLTIKTQYIERVKITDGKAGKVKILIGG